MTRYEKKKYHGNAVSMMIDDLGPEPVKLCHPLKTKPSYYVSDLSPYLIHDQGEGEITFIKADGTNRKTDGTYKSLRKTVQLPPQYSDMKSCRGFCAYRPWVYEWMDESIQPEYSHAEVFQSTQKKGEMECLWHRTDTTKPPQYSIVVMWFGDIVEQEVLMFAFDDDDDDDFPSLVDVERVISVLREDLEPMILEGSYDVPTLLLNEDGIGLDKRILLNGKGDGLFRGNLVAMSTITIPTCNVSGVFGGVTSIGYALSIGSATETRFDDGVDLISDNLLETLSRTSKLSTPELNVEPYISVVEKLMTRALHQGTQQGNTWQMFSRGVKKTKFDMRSDNREFLVRGPHPLRREDVVEVVSMKTHTTFVLIDKDGHVYFQRYLAPIKRKPQARVSRDYWVWRDE